MLSFSNLSASCSQLDIKEAFIQRMGCMQPLPMLDSSFVIFLPPQSFGFVTPEWDAMYKGTSEMSSGAAFLMWSHSYKCDSRVPKECTLLFRITLLVFRCQDITSAEGLLLERITFQPRLCPIIIYRPHLFRFTFYMRQNSSSGQQLILHYLFSF